MLSTTSVASRLTLVSSITTEAGAEGDTLDTLNVNNMVDGALVYVANIGKFYQLRKNLPVTVVAANPNVIAGAGSSAELGFFVAVTQTAEGVLSGSGTALFHGFSLSLNAALAAVYVTPGGAQGFLSAARTDDHSVTVTSSSSSDTSTVLVFTVPALGSP